MATEDAAVQAGMSQAVGTRLFRKAGGMPPAMFRPSAKSLSGRYLSFAEREEILRVQCCSMREVPPRAEPKNVAKQEANMPSDQIA